MLGVSQTPPIPYPGERLGLPVSGPGSTAGWGRRVIALGIDWVASLLFVAAFVGNEVFSGRGPVALWGPLVVFAAERWLFTSLLGASVGQLLMRIRVVRLAGGRLGTLRVLVRTLLICLVVPAAVSDRDGRGLHDMAVGSIVIRT